MGIDRNHSPHLCAWRFVAALTGAVFVVAGCSKTPARVNAAAEDQELAAAADSDSGATTKVPRPAARKKKSGKLPGAHIGEIPLDAWPEVWLKDPLSVASEKAPAGGAVAGTTGSPPLQVSKNSAAESAGKSGADAGAAAKATR